MRRPYEGHLSLRRGGALPRPLPRRAGGFKTRPGVTRRETPYMRVAQPAEIAEIAFRLIQVTLHISTHALVAQLDRAPDFESGGRGFESLRARQ
jgi:hypothetical protein